MKTLSRYILLVYLRMLGLCLGALGSIYLVIDFLEKVRKFSGPQFGPYRMAVLFLNRLPEIFTDVAPMATLLATVLALGILARNSEITAMRSCGIGLGTIVAPILCAALATSAAVLAVNELVVPGTYQKVRYIEEVELRGKGTQAFFRQNNIWFREKGTILQAKLFDPAKKTLRGVTLWRVDDALAPQARIDAGEALWNGASWEFRQVVEQTFSPSGIARRSYPAREMALGLKTPDLKKISRGADEMSFFQLRTYCGNLRKGGFDAGRYVTKMHGKLATPFAPLVMALVAIPFSFRGGRSSGTAFGIGQSLAIGFGYFMMNAIMLALGQNGVLPALVAAWATNIIFCIAAAWLALTLET